MEKEQSQNKSNIAAGIALFLFCASFIPSSRAVDSGTNSFQATATIPSQCSVSATNLVFGNNYNGTANVDAQNTVTVNCKEGINYGVILSAGNSGDATQRYMQDNAATPNLLYYNIYLDAGHTTIWGNEDQGGEGQTGTGTGTDTPYVGYGRIFASPNVPPPGDYSDNIFVAVAF